MDETWRVVTSRGSAADLHADLPDPAVRTVRVADVAGPAVVLGSAEPADHVDVAAAAAAGVAVTRRRSGGGAVWLAPGQQVWLDVALPRGDPLWDDDVSHAGAWLGAVWGAALADLGLGGATVHTGPMARPAWSDRVCFAGTAAGEVRVGAAKAVGVSQRRTRAGAVFQATAYVRPVPAVFAALLGVPAAVTAVAVVDATPAAVVAAVLTHLPGGAA